MRTLQTFSGGVLVLQVLSVIDDSHKKPIVAIEFLPATIELERRGRGPAIEKYPKDVTAYLEQTE